MTPYLGEIRMFAGTFVPLGWVPCDGRLLSISEHDALYTLIGTTFGGDGQEYFAVPDLRGRTPVGTGTSTSSGQTYVLGQAGGQEEVTLSVQQMPSHRHTALGSVAAATSGDPAGGTWAAADGTAFGDGPGEASMAPGALAQAGGSQPHENRSPVLAVQMMISLSGVYPAPA